MSIIEATRPCAALAVGTWTIDPAHSYLGFRVKHLGLIDVRGRFLEFGGSLAVTARGAIYAEGTITAASVDTGQPQRDEHLRGPEFLDAANHPQISFRSTMFEPLGQATSRVIGDLTIHGVTREVFLDAEISGTEQDLWGHTRVGLERLVLSRDCQHGTGVASSRRTLSANEGEIAARCVMHAAICGARRLMRS